MAILDRLSFSPTFTTEQLQAMDTSRTVLDVARQITAEAPGLTETESCYMQRRITVTSTSVNTAPSTMHYDITTFLDEPEPERFGTHRFTRQPRAYSVLTVALRGCVCISLADEPAIYREHDLYAVHQPDTPLHGQGLIISTLNKYRGGVVPHSLQAWVAYVTQTLGIAQLSTEPGRVERRNQRRLASGKWHPRIHISNLEQPTLQNTEQAHELVATLRTIQALGRTGTVHPSITADERGGFRPILSARAQSGR